MSGELESRIMALAEPRLAEQGLTLVDLELARQGGRLWVRLFIDRADRSAGGVTVEECGEFNLSFGRVLEVEDLVGESYVLEVSSPGLNRRLRKVSDFQRYVGQKVVVVTKVAIGGRKKIRGRLVAADEGGITVEVGGERIEVPHGEIARANLEYEFEK